MSNTAIINLETFGLSSKKSYPFAAGALVIGADMKKKWSGGYLFDWGKHAFVYRIVERILPKGKAMIVACLKRNWKTSLERITWEEYRTGEKFRELIWKLHDDFGVTDILTYNGGFFLSFYHKSFEGFEDEKPEIKVTGIMESAQRKDLNLYQFYKALATEHKRPVNVEFKEVDVLNIQQLSIPERNRLMFEILKFVDEHRKTGNKIPKPTKKQKVKE